MDEVVKVNFMRPMLVLKIRETYKAPYHKNKYLTIKQKDSQTMAILKKHINQFTNNWSSGIYDLQFVQKEGTYMQPAIYATFCRIDVRDGKVVKLEKASPFTKKVYPCWQYFQRKKRVTKEKPIKKKILKKKTVKKKISKK